jgi:Phage tail lysozyme
VTQVHVTAPMLAAFNHFTSVGFVENGAGAAVGNFCQESGELLIATMFREHPDYSGGVPDALKSGGIAEWLGARKTAYIDFSGRAETRLGLAKGSLLNDLGTQCDFVVYELQTTPEYATLYQQLTSGSRSVANLTANFMMVYERPKLGPTAGLDNRIAHAEAVVARARELKAAPVPQAAPSAPVPQASLPSAPMPLPMPTTVPAVPAPILPTSAGRIATQIDTLTAMRAARVSELVAADQEIAAYDESLAAFTKLGGASATTAPPPLLQKPAAGPAVMTTTQGTTMPSFAINWKTTLSGIVAAAGILAAQFPPLAPYAQVVTALGTLALGFTAKDAAVTGGTIPATNEAKARAASPPIGK